MLIRSLTTIKICYCFLILLLINSCYLNDCTEVIEYFGQDFPKKEHYYPNCTNKSKYIEITYYDNGREKSGRYMLNGKMEGEYKTWHPNGKLSSIWQAKNDELIGEFKYYNEEEELVSDGIIKREANEINHYMYLKNGFVYDKGVGTKINHADSINLPFEEKWIENLFIDDKLSYLRTYENGFMNGQSFSYYKNGQLEEAFIYKDNEIDGLYSYYDSTGVLRMKGLKYDTTRLGTWHFWNESGVLDTIVDFGELSQSEKDSIRSRHYCMFSNIRL